MDDFIRGLISKRPTWDDFLAKFKQIAFTNHKNLYKEIIINKKKTQYVLKEFEIDLQKNEEYSSPSFSIEHIKDDKDGGKACFIGNMIPLPPRKNGKLSGKTMVQKQQVYKDSYFSSTRRFSNHPNCLTWDDNEIEKRSEALAKEFYYRIWEL